MPTVPGGPAYAGRPAYTDPIRHNLQHQHHAHRDSGIGRWSEDALDLDAPHLAGEAAQGPTAAAIANAVADSTGVRLRDIP